MMTIDGDVAARARRAVGSIRIDRWQEVAPLLRLRTVRSADRSAPAKAIAPGLWLEVALSVPAATDGPGSTPDCEDRFMVRPTPRNLAAWNRSPGSVWRVATGNTRAMPGPETAVSRHDGFTLRLAAGDPWTTGALIDVGYFVRRWWPEATGWHRAGPWHGDRDRTEAWACALSPTSLAVVEPNSVGADRVPPDQVVVQGLLQALTSEEGYPSELIAAPMMSCLVHPNRRLSI